MKKYNLLIIGILFSIWVNGQSPVVSAPVLEAQGAKSSAIQMEQLAQEAATAKALEDSYVVLNESYTALEKTQSFYTKVSSAVSTSEQINRLTQQQYAFIKRAGVIMVSIKQMQLSRAEITRANLKISGLLRQGTSNIKMLTQLVTNDNINTDDGTRLLLINQIIEQQDKLDRDLRLTNRVYNQKNDLNNFYSNIKK